MQATKLLFMIDICDFGSFAGPEYGTMEAAWKAVLVESDRRCDLHNRVRDDLQMKANNELKNWQKENYHKVLLKVSLNFCAHAFFFTTENTDDVYLNTFCVK